METTNWEKYEKLVLSKLDEYLDMINELYNETQSIKMDLIKLETKLTIAVSISSLIGSSIVSVIIGFIMNNILK